jgi:hypothetical protein
MPARDLPPNTLYDGDNLRVLREHVADVGLECRVGVAATRPERPARIQPRAERSAALG